MKEHHQTIAARKRASNPKKRCYKCKEWKGRSLFFKHEQAFDGLNCYCKSCQALRASAYRRSEKGGVIARKVDRQWRQRNPKKVSEYQRKYRRENLEKTVAWHRRYRKENPDKCHARARINNLICGGKIIRGDCEVCGAPNAQAHHDDYSKPLDVRWFCATHHKMYHWKEQVDD